jgi:hypothetical protein
MISKAAKYFGIGFLIGIAAPSLIAVFAVLINFDAGLRLASVFVPFGSFLADKFDDGFVTITNGLLYGTIACLATLLHAAWRPRRT